jgi:L-iditol 2-dehydrogenase
MKSIKKVGKTPIIQDEPLPFCNEGDIVIKMEACGICGSDLLNISGLSCKPSTKIGHEVAGSIIKVSKNQKHFQVGDRVFVHHHASCDECYLCRANCQTMCDKFTDSLEPCGMAEEFVVPEWNVRKGCLFKIPDSISFEEAAMIEPLGCCIRAWKKILQNRRSLAIFGAGPIGILHASLAKLRNIDKIFCIDINDFRLSFCQQRNIGFAINFSDTNLEEKIIGCTNNYGVDIAIIATSDMTTIDTALKIVRKGGIVLLMGEPMVGSVRDIDLTVVYNKEISIITSYAASNEDIKDALNLIVAGDIKINQLITHKFPFDESIKALQFANSRNGSLKVMITSNNS